MNRVSAYGTALAAAVLLLASAPVTNAVAATAGEIVDIQFSLCDAPAQVERALDLRRKGSPVNVWLFDDAALGLFARGLRLRLRETKRGAELTLKAADQDCASLPPEALPAGEGKCEYDQHGAKIAGALSLTRALDTRTAQALAAGREPLAGQLSGAQKHFLQGVPGAWPLPPDIRVLGPTRVVSYRTQGKRYAVDVSELPGGERFIEISRKVARTDSVSAHDQFVADLDKAGVAVCADQSAQAINKLRALMASLPDRRNLPKN